MLLGWGRTLLADYSLPQGCLCLCWQLNQSYLLHAVVGSLVACVGHVGHAVIGHVGHVERVVIGHVVVGHVGHMVIGHVGHVVVGHGNIGHVGGGGSSVDVLYGLPAV